MSRVQTLNGVHVSCHHTSARDFECSGPPSLSQTGENVENIHQIMSLAHISLMELLVVLRVFSVELCCTRPKQLWDYITGVILAG